MYYFLGPYNWRRRKGPRAERLEGSAIDADIDEEEEEEEEEEKEKGEEDGAVVTIDAADGDADADRNALVNNGIWIGGTNWLIPRRDSINLTRLRSSRPES